MQRKWQNGDRFVFLCNLGLKSMTFVMHVHATWNCYTSRFVRVITAMSASVNSLQFSFRLAWPKVRHGTRGALLKFWKQPCENWISYSKIGAFWLNAKHSPKHGKKLSQKQIARMAIIVIVCEDFFHDFSFLNTCRCKNKQKYVLLQQYWQLMLHYVFTPCFKLFFPSFNSLVGVQKLCFLMRFPTHWCCAPSAVIVREATSVIYDMMFLQFDDELCWKERTWVLRKSC